MSFRLEEHATSESTAAWRAFEPDAPGLFAIITDEHGLAVPMAPETNDMIIAIFDETVPETLGSIEIDGRAGLVRWYIANVGHDPDAEPGGPVPILELINNVAAHLLLRYHEADQDALRAERPRTDGQ